MSDNKPDASAIPVDIVIRHHTDGTVDVIYKTELAVLKSPELQAEMVDYVLAHHRASRKNKTRVILEFR